MKSLVWFHDEIPKYLLWPSEEGDTHRMGKRNGMEEEVPGADLCRVQLLSNSSPQHQPEISQALEDLGLPESVQSCLHPQMGDLVPKRTWKCFKSSDHPFPTQEKDQVCPCRIVTQTQEG